MSRRPLTVLIGLLCLASASSLGCRKQATETPDKDAAAGEDAGAATPAEAEAVTPEETCAKMLERFGEDVAEAESESCVEALTTGTELGVCQDAELEGDYLDCVHSCMASVDLDPAEYNPADSSTSPIVNCVAGCFSTTCQ